MSILIAHNLKKFYGNEPNIIRALNEVDIQITVGEFVAVMGMSGSGKSTLLHMLGGLTRPTEGTVVVNGNELYSMSDEQLTIFRRRYIGFVFQCFNLIPILNVYENIVLPIELDGNIPDKSFVEEILDALGMRGNRNSMPSQLSGGQQQRVAIARALASKPSVILADEPTGNLDSITSRNVIDILRATSTRYKQTMIIITHNEMISKLADRVIHIEDGKIVNGVSKE